MKHRHRENSPTSPHLRAPAILRYQDKLVSASDFWSDSTRTLFRHYGFSEESIDQILRGRTLSKLSHGYTKVTLRRTGDRYFDHTTWVALLLLMEFWEKDPDVLSAAYDHDILEDVRISPREMRNLMKATIWEEAFRLAWAVTNPEETWDTEKDNIAKTEHYGLIGYDRRSAALKIADRCYNLRTLEIMVFPEDQITEKHLQSAEDQIEETKKYILPIAKKYSTEKHPYEKILSQDIEKVEEHISEVRILLLQRETKKHIDTHIQHELPLWKISR